LLFGSNQRRPVLDELSEYLEEKFSLSNPCDITSERIKANENIKRSQARNESIYALRHKALMKYNNNDFVAIRNVDVRPGHCKKFAPKYRGPYKISRVLPNDRYEVTDIKDCQLTQLPYREILEAARLKPWMQVCNKTVGLCV